MQQEAREKADAEAKRAAETDLMELKGLADRGEALAPDRAWELSFKTIASAIASPHPVGGAQSTLITKLQEMAPEVYRRQVTAMAHSGCFMNLISSGADPTVVNVTMVLRAQLIGEFGLSTCGELMTLDTALRHRVESTQAMAKAQRASKASDYARYVATAQASDKLYTNLIQQLRVRHQPRVPAVHVSNAGTVAVMVNEASPSAEAKADHAKPVLSQRVVDVPAAETGPRLFGKNG
jgi:hypothetical protein